MSVLKHAVDVYLAAGGVMLLLPVGNRLLRGVIEVADCYVQPHRGSLRYRTQHPGKPGQAEESACAVDGHQVDREITGCRIVRCVAPEAPSSS